MSQIWRASRSSTLSGDSKAKYAWPCSPVSDSAKCENRRSGGATIVAPKLTSYGAIAHPNAHRFAVTSARAIASDPNARPYAGTGLVAIYPTPGSHHGNAVVGLARIGHWKTFKNHDSAFHGEECHTSYSENPGGTAAVYLSPATLQVDYEVDGRFCQSSRRRRRSKQYADKSGDCAVTPVHAQAEPRKGNYKLHYVGAA
jgi:hypothetical protein